jgi:hypothetical protein
VLIVTERRFLPFALLLLITALPDLVAILTRKPWVLNLLFLLGWNVLFGMAFSFMTPVFFF